MRSSRASRLRHGGRSTSSLAPCPRCHISTGSSRRRIRHDRDDGRDREHLPRHAPTLPDRPCRPESRSGLARHRSAARRTAARPPGVRRPTPRRSPDRIPLCDSRRHRRRPGRSTRQRRTGLQRADARSHHEAGDRAGRGTPRESGCAAWAARIRASSVASVGVGSSRSPPTMTRVALARSAGSEANTSARRAIPFNSFSRPTDRTIGSPWRPGGSAATPSSRNPSAPVISPASPSASRTARPYVWPATPWAGTRPWRHVGSGRRRFLPVRP